MRFPKSKKQVQRYIGLVNYYRNYISRLTEKLLGFYELLKADKQIKVTEELLDNYKSINAALAEACGLALKKPITRRQYFLMTDASFRASGNAQMIEEDNDKKTQFRKENFRPSCIRIESVFPSPTKNVNLLQRVHAFLEYSYILWETTLPTLVMTDNRSVTRFFQTKVIHTARDFPSSIDLNPKETVELKIRKDITIRPIQFDL